MSLVHIFLLLMVECQTRYGVLTMQKYNFKTSQIHYMNSVTMTPSSNSKLCECILELHTNVEKQPDVSFIHVISDRFYMFNGI